MPTLKIIIPDNEFEDLTKGMKDNDLSDSSLNNKQNLDSKLLNIIKQVKYYLKLYKAINLKEAFPEYDFNEILPQLKVGEDGYAQYDVEEVFAGFDYDPEHYAEFSNEDIDILTEMVFKSNKDFDLQEILTYLNVMDMSIPYEDLLKIVLTINMEIEQFNNNGEEFKTKNATMIFEINGNISSFNKVTFKIAGALSRMFPKPMFNIKIKNGENLYGRSHFKLRPDMTDPTYLRSKLVSDIRNRVGIKSISANYIQFYLNNEFMGLYIMTDVINLPWIKDVYSDKKSTSLYKCDGLIDFTANYSNLCVNKNEDVTDHSEWINFLKAVENAESGSDLEDILDIDHLLYEMGIDYLTNASDHYVHNFYMYKQPNGKWTYISFDFDLDFSSLLGDVSEEDYFKSFTIGNRNRFYNLFISQDRERFNTILKDIVEKVFNPATLYPHIDEIKQFISPYVKLDKTPDSNGKYPGEINERSSKEIIPYEEWDKVTEFEATSYDIGLKYIILQKYRLVCSQLNMECDPIYMDENYLNGVTNYQTDYDKNNLYSTEYEIPTEIPTEIPSDIPSDIPSEIPSEYSTNSSSTEPFIEEETAYEVDEPTFSTDEESSFDEEDNESDESVTENVTTKTTKTITKTQTIIYTTVLN